MKRDIRNLVLIAVDTHSEPLPAPVGEILAEAAKRDLSGLMVHCGQYGEDDDISGVTDDEIIQALHTWLYSWEGNDCGPALWGSV